jgi:DNA-binding transcriptional LysR family regulator
MSGVVSISSMLRPLPRIDTDQLQAFARVVREGSFSRAAVALGVGQPAVSARIQALEAAVGGALFTRGRRVALTPLGDAFLAYASRALDVLGAGVDDARQVRAGDRGRVSLATLNSLAAGLVAPALTALIAARPGLGCLVRAAAHEEVAAMVWDGVVELGLLLWPCPELDAAGVEPLLVIDEPVVLAVSPRHPLAGRRSVTCADVAAHARPLLRLRWWRSHHPAIAQLADETGAVLEVPLEVALVLVADGRAAGFFPRTLIAGELARGALVAVPVADLAPLTRRCALVRRTRATPPPPATALFVDALTAQAQRLGLVPPAKRRRHGR